MTTDTRRAENPATGPGEAETTIHDCEDFSPDSYLLSGWRQDGERWKCPKCGQIWEHQCDEAEGCYWEPVVPPSGGDSAKRVVSP